MASDTINRDGTDVRRYVLQRWIPMEGETIHRDAK